MEDLLQSSTSALPLSKETRKELKRMKKRNRKEKKLAAKSESLSTTSDGAVHEPALSAKLSKKKTNGSTKVGLDDVVREFSQIMRKTEAPVADKNENKEPLADPEIPETPKAAEADAVTDRHTENNGLSSPWIVRSKAQIIDWNENTASKCSKLAAADEKTMSRKKEDWSVAEIRAKHASQYGADVKSWTGGSSIADEASGAAKERRKRQQRPDFYDSEYDRGRIKKVKKNRHNKFAATVNPYQMYSEHTFKKSK
ncbi:hypothetical protein EV175_006544 [Coemansia sp. RSA 1933]|nr:hypothetical protein EV175_006544 [Coemansia sp. RSA 1933]